MPFSHIGLPVRDTDRAAKFYAAALAPLGYRFVAQRDAQIGFGVEEADFFLSPTASKTSGMHLAFVAASFAQVHDFYDAALDAGAIQSGPPAYRGDQAQTYNAAVIDPEGNTVEVVYHIPPAPRDLPRSSSPKSIHPRSSPKSRSGPTSHTSAYHDRPSPHDSHDGDPSAPSKALVNTLLGAAASAAVVCAVLRDKPSSTGGRRSSRGSNNKPHALSVRTVYDIDAHSERVRPRGPPERIIPGSRRDSLVSAGKSRRRSSFSEERSRTPVDDARSSRRGSLVDTRYPPLSRRGSHDSRRGSAVDSRRGSIFSRAEHFHGVPSTPLTPDDSISCIGIRRR